MYKIILAIRYMFKKRISYFSVAAVALCVFVTLVVITVLSGLAGEFKKNTHLLVGDCVVSSKSLVGFGYYEEFMDKLESENFVEAASPVIKSYALVKLIADNAFYGMTRGNETAEIMGIYPALHSRVTGLEQWVHYNKGNITNMFKPGYDQELIGCAPGIDFLHERGPKGNYNLPENPLKLGIEISSFPLTAKGALAKAGTGVVNSKTFYYSDTVRSKLAMADWKRIYIPFDQAQRLCGMAGGIKRINAIHIKFKPLVSPDAGCEKVKQLWAQFAKEKSTAKQGSLLGKVRVQSWKIHSRSVVAAMETEQIMMMVIFAMIGIITVFIVFVVFYMIVCHKSKDIGILKSIGVSSPNILSLFLGFAFLVGLLGSSLGTLMGWQFLVHINRIESWLFKNFGFQLWNRSMYAIGDIPNAIDIKLLAGIVISAIGVCLLGALLPSWQAARLKPVETLQVSQI